MRIVCIGAGNVASHLAKDLFEKGFTIAQIVSRTEQSASGLAQCVNAEWTTSIEEAQPADLYLYSVSDSALEDVIRRNPYHEGFHIHTAGSMPLSVFEGNKKKHGILYPLQTFSKDKPLKLDEVPLFVEAGTHHDLQELKALATLLSPKVYEANSSQRQQLHLAAVFCCNFSNHLFAIADTLLKEANLPFEIVRPLIQETIDKTSTLPPREAQTGPAVRNDQNVMEKHLTKLTDHSQWQEIYRLLSDSIQKNAES